MPRSSRGNDPVLDFILGRDSARLSLATALSIAFGAFLVVAAATSAVALPPTAAFLAVIVIVIAVSWWAAPAVALVVGAIGFLFANGFAFDTQGTLEWHGEVDLVRFVCLIVLALTSSVIGHRNVDLERRRRLLRLAVRPTRTLTLADKEGE